MNSLDTLNIRRLSGMQYASVEIEHLVSTPMAEVLYALAEYLTDNDETGLLTGIYTQSHPDQEDKFLTQLVWAI